MDREIPMFGFMRKPIVLSALALWVLACHPARAQTLSAVKERGTLNCGVSQGLLGFSSMDEDDKSRWTGFDVDICRAVAAAIFGDPTKVTFMPLDAAARFTALRSNKIDVLSRNSTWTMSRESSLGLLFTGVAYYDGQGFLVRRDAGIDTALQLGEKTVCTQTGTTSELNLSDYFRANDMVLKVSAFSTAEESLNDDRKCDVLTSDVSQLYAERLKLTAPDSHMILPEIISKEPLGPAVRQGDDQWFNLIKWTLYSLINAEELGVKSATIDDAVKSTNPNIRRLVGNEGEFGEQLGLTKDWAARAVRAVGNYGEIYERNVGTQSRLSIPRGLNALWTQGGIQYAPPIR
jgi:general L-amino acid transport system substrate-binding protein